MNWMDVIDPFLVSCAMSSAMLLPRRSKPLDGCFHPQVASERSSFALAFAYLRSNNGYLGQYLIKKLYAHTEYSQSNHPSVWKSAFLSLGIIFATRVVSYEYEHALIKAKAC